MSASGVRSPSRALSCEQELLGNSVGYEQSGGFMIRLIYIPKCVNESQFSSRIQIQ